MVRPLDYNSGISTQEAKERIKEIEEAFESVKKNYSGFLSRFKKNMGTEDQKTLADCIGVLLPLSQEASVQEEVLQAAREEMEKKTHVVTTTVHYKTGDLQSRILDYLTRFNNTGVAILPKEAASAFFGD